jgi:gluconolactonase
MKHRRHLILLTNSIIMLAAVCLLAACSGNKSLKTIGSIERLDPALDALIGPDASIEIIAEGFTWSEGPLWLESEKKLLFSDVPENKIYQWTEEKGHEVYLTPSGYTGTVPRGGEPGSNGLLLDDQGNLLLCQHGDRRLARMDAPLNAPQPNFVTLGGDLNGKKFNSPNDAVIKNGKYYLTDPSYGLAHDTLRETPFNGVYRIDAQGQARLLVDSITNPNGIAFVGDMLVVANSNPAKAIWYGIDLNENDSVTGVRVFVDATEAAKKDHGAPDGFKVDKQGNLFASGPGGLWIMNKEGKVLGKLRIPAATSNCALADDDKTLYITADAYVLRLKMR